MRQLLIIIVARIVRRITSRANKYRHYTYTVIVMVSGLLCVWIWIVLYRLLCLCVCALLNALGVCDDAVDIVFHTQNNTETEQKRSKYLRSK